MKKNPQMPSARRILGMVVGIVIIGLGIALFKQPVVFGFRRNILRIQLLLELWALQLYRLLHPFAETFKCGNS